MKKLFVIPFYFATFLTCQNVFGQKTFFSLGGELTLPFGNLKDVAGTGIGGSFRLESSFSKHVAGIVTIGYLKFAPKEINPFLIYKLRTVPIQAGIKYYSQEKKEIRKGFYISGEAGVTSETTISNFVGDKIYSDSELGLSSAAGAGYQFRNVELSFRLQSFLTWEYWCSFYHSFRLAYTFQKRK